MTDATDFNPALAEAARTSNQPLSMTETSTRETAAHDGTDAAQLRLHTTMSWHPADHERVRQALAAALDALDERADTSRFMLDDPHVYGLADPARLRHQIDTDHNARLVLRSFLDDGTHQHPQ